MLVADRLDVAAGLRTLKPGNPCSLLGRHRPVPAEMPLADAGGPHALLLGERADRHPVGSDEWLLPGAHDPRLQPRPPVIAAGEERVAGGGTDSRRRMGVGKPHALRGELVDVRRGDPPTVGVVAVDIAVAEIVGVDHHNVGSGVGSGECRLALAEEAEGCGQPTQDAVHHDERSPT